MELKRIVLVLFLIGIIAVSVSFVSAGEKVTVKGTEFELPDDAEIWQEQDTLVNFEVNGGMKGLIATIYDDADLGSYIENDTDYIVSEIDVASIEPQAYCFADGLMDNRGYFIIFQKNGQQYVFEIYTPGATDTGGIFSLEDEKTEYMAQEVFEFYNKNIGLEPI